MDVFASRLRERAAQLGVFDAPLVDVRQATIDRIVTVVGNLPDEVLDLVVIQLDALAAARGRGVPPR